MSEFDLSDVKVGDTVYIVSSDGRDRPYESVVKTVGRKYITVDNGYYTKFNKENGINSEWCHWRMYSSKQAYEAEQEMKEIDFGALQTLRYIHKKNTEMFYYHAADFRLGAGASQAQAQTAENADGQSVRRNGVLCRLRREDVSEPPQE